MSNEMKDPTNTESVASATPATNTALDSSSTNSITAPDSASTSATDTSKPSTNNTFDGKSTATKSPYSGASASAATSNVTKKDEEQPVKKKTEIKLDAATLRALAQKAIKGFLRYAPILFFLLVAIVYGFVVIRINSLSNAQPSQSDIDAQTTTTAIPRIDPNTAKRLENLEDNSQNVQTLFDEARKNPFD